MGPKWTQFCTSYSYLQWQCRCKFDKFPHIIQIKYNLLGWLLELESLSEPHYSGTQFYFQSGTNTENTTLFLIRNKRCTLGGFVNQCIKCKAPNSVKCCQPGALHWAPCYREFCMSRLVCSQLWCVFLPNESHSLISSAHITHSIPGHILCFNSITVSQMYVHPLVVLLTASRTHILHKPV